MKHFKIVYLYIHTSVWHNFSSINLLSEKKINHTEDFIIKDQPHRKQSDIFRAQTMTNKEHKCLYTTMNYRPLHFHYKCSTQSTFYSYHHSYYYYYYYYYYYDYYDYVYVFFWSCKGCQMIDPSVVYLKRTVEKHPSPFMNLWHESLWSRSVAVTLKII